MKSIKIAGLCLALAGLVAGAQAQQQVDERVEARPDGDVEVENIAGSVRVEGWSEEAVRVTGTLGDELELRLEGKGRRTVVEVRSPDSGDRWGSRRDNADIVVHVPVASTLRIETVSADIQARALSGRAQVKSVSGEIDLDLQSQEIDVESVSGDIRVTSTQAKVESESVSGETEVHLQAGEFDIESVSGDVVVVAGTLRAGEAQSVSGDLRIEAALDKGCRLDLESHSGDIDLTLPQDSSTEVALETYSGRMDVPQVQDEAPPDTPRGRREREMELLLGAGDGRIEMTTFSGDLGVHIE